MRSKSLSRIDDTLEGLEPGSYRYQVLDACRRFKTSWIELGQSLIAVHRDKQYLGWGFPSFEKYCTSELGIRNNTAQKLLRSYHFLESDEPAYLEKAKETAAESRHPDLDSVNLLRLAKKSKRIEEKDYEDLKEKVLDRAQEPQEVRKTIRLMSERNNTQDPEEARADRRVTFLKRTYRTFESIKLEAMGNRFLPPKLIDALDTLSQQVERELNRE